MTRVGLAQALQPALLRLEEIRHAQWKGQQAGLSVAVISDQDLLWAKGLGYADYARQIPATPQTIYRIASITKLFTATMLMQLRDAGQVQLDDPLTRYLPPSFTIISPFPDAKAPTLRQVVSHTAGLPREAPFDYEEAVPIPSIEVILDEIREIELLVPPMTEWRYSNLGVALLGHALERIAHQPYKHYVVEKILRPLGMSLSGFDITAEMQPYVATAYAPSREDGHLEVVPYAYQDMGGLVPVGGMYSSAEELARFISLQFRDGPAEGSQILRGSTLREMHAPVFILPSWKSAVGISWGLLPLGDHTVLYHTGGAPGFKAFVVVVPSIKLGVALLANTEQLPDGFYSQVVERGLEVLVQAIEGLQAQQVPLHGQGVPPEWYAYQGNYYRSSKYYQEKILKTILIADGKLLWRDPDGRIQGEFVPVQAERFRMKGGAFDQELAIFTKNATGKIVQVKMGNRIFLRE